jgi:hypothetical protein
MTKEYFDRWISRNEGTIDAFHELSILVSNIQCTLIIGKTIDEDIPYYCNGNIKAYYKLGDHVHHAMRDCLMTAYSPFQVFCPELVGLYKSQGIKDQE